MMRNMKTVSVLAALFCLALAWSGAAVSAAETPGKKSLGVSDVKISPSLVESVEKSGKHLSLGRVSEAMDGQLIAAINATRKFDVISRSDLDSVLKEQGFATSGNVDANDKAAAKPMKVRGINYLVVTTVDDFQDFVEKAVFADIDVAGTKRVIRLSCVAKIYDSTTGKLLEAPNFQIAVKDISRKPGTSTTDGELSDSLLLQAARQMSELIANRVNDVVYPAKIMAVSGTQATVNRGDGTSVAVGQVWDVFALGEDMKDPDTGESLGREETKVGAIQITSVLPKFSKGLVTEIAPGQAIATGQIVRLRVPPAPAGQ